nr:ATP synthase F0 subunit 8 [Zicrona caerulea]QVH34046.1 ATP synthase F0 subunit 8 [Zicrona caerulea]
MSPLWWEILFIIFVMTYILFNIMIYYVSIWSVGSMVLNNKKIKNMNWTW